MSRLPSSFDGPTEDSEIENTFYDKIVSNCKEQPLVPLGTLLTTGAVILAAKSLRVGARRDAQKWFRYRVAFQGFTIAALVAGGYYYGTGDKDAKKKKEDALREKAKLREKLWIEELERRDLEAKKRHERAEKARLKTIEMNEKAEKLQKEIEEIKKK